MRTILKNWAGQFCLVAVFLALYIPFRSINYDPNGIDEARTVEIATPVSLFHANHLLYRGIGFAIYRLALLVSLGARAITYLQLLAAICGGIGVYLAFKAFVELSGSIIAAFTAALWYGTSLAYWSFSTDAAYIVPAAAVSAAALFCFTKTRNLKHAVILGILCGIAVLLWQAAIFLLIGFSFALFSKDRQHFVPTLLSLVAGCLVTVIVGYLFAGYAVLNTASPLAIFTWVANYRVDRPPIWGTLGMGRVPSALTTALASLVPVPPQWMRVEAFVLIAALAELLILVPVLSYLFRAIKSRNITASNTWLVVAYLGFWPFIVWWDPYEPKWFVVPNLFVAAFIAMAWTNWIRMYPRLTLLLAASVLTIALVNFSSTIWPRHSQPNDVLITAGCIAKNLHQGDLFLATDWQWANYLPYFFDRDVLSAVSEATHSPTSDSFRAAIDHAVASTAELGGTTYMRSPDSHSESEREVLKQLGVPTTELFQIKMQQAFTCDRWRFGKVIPTLVRPAKSLLAIKNLTVPTSDELFRAGDQWELTLTNATSNKLVYLRIWKDGHSQEVSGPYGALTDVSGEWKMIGEYGARDVGRWLVQAVVGSRSSDERSQIVAVNVSPANSPSHD